MKKNKLFLKIQPGKHGKGSLFSKTNLSAFPAIYRPNLKFKRISDPSTHGIRVILLNFCDK